MDRAVANHGNRPCTNFLGRTMTYKEIGALVDRTAAGLQKLGVTKGTKVGLFLPNCPTFVIYYYAILKAGGTVVNFNPLYTLEELTYQLKDSDTEIMVTLDLKVLFDKVDALLQSDALPRAIVASFASLLPSAKSVLFKLFKAKELARPAASPAARKIVLDADLIAGAGAPTPVEIDPHTDVAVLQYTGGTTGTPKGRDADARQCLLQRAAGGVLGAGARSTAQERVLGVLPFFHVFAMTVVMNFGIAKASEMLIMPRFVLDDALKLIDKGKPTMMPGVPTLFNALLNHPKLKIVRPVVAEVLSFRRRGAAARSEAELRARNRMQAGRGLWPVGNLACRHLQSAQRPGERWRDRHAAAGHDRVAARSVGSDARGSAGRARRSVHLRTAGHDGLLQAPRRDRRSIHRPLPAHRRRRRSWIRKASSTSSTASRT